MFIALRKQQYYWQGRKQTMKKAKGKVEFENLKFYTIFFFLPKDYLIKLSALNPLNINFKPQKPNNLELRVFFIH